MQPSPDVHPFTRRPNRTLIALSIPVTLSIIAEPITGLVDTAFVGNLGASEPLAALGIGTTALSTMFWIFNFLGISTQTEVAKALGNGERHRAAAITSLALIVALFLTTLTIIVFLPTAGIVSDLLGAAPEVRDDAVTYLQIRLFGAPAVLMAFIAFAAMRGLQDMRTPLIIAVAINVMNIILDGPMIFGWGPFPRMEIAGAALASTFSQWVGAVWALYHIRRELGLVFHVDWDDLRTLLRVGGDLFVRTGLLTLFLLISTRVANQISPDAGAAHQALRTLWTFFGMTMEGFAVTAQSLVGYFMGARQVNRARQAAALASQWSLGLGLALVAVLIVGREAVISAIVPPEAVNAFNTAFFAAVLSIPVAGVAFAADGIHWGTGDYTFLRNVMIMATVSSGVLLLLIDTTTPNAFLHVWIVMIWWVLVRAAFGMARVWPGFGNSPLRAETLPKSKTVA